MKNVGYRQIVIIVGVKIEMQMGIAADHFAAKISRFIRSEDTQCREHESVVGLLIYHYQVSVFFGMTHTV